MEVLMNLYLPYSFICWRKWMSILRKWTEKGVLRWLQFPLPISRPPFLPYYLPLPINPVSLSNRAFPCNQWYHVLHRKINYSSFFSIDQCRQLEFRAALAFRGKRLLNHKIKEVYNVAKDFCGALCFMEPNCISYNILVSNDSPSITKCEMNNATHFEHPSDLVSFPNSTYRWSKVCL